MVPIKGFVTISLTTIAIAWSISAAPDPNFYLFLCTGQSNMAGGCKPGDATDCDTTSANAKRVKVMAFRDCNEMSTACTAYKLVRTADKWYTGYPPYNNCNEGIGPADYFGKTMVDSIGTECKIGIIPCSFSGQDIGLFLKNNTSFTAPTWAHPTVGKDVYKFMVARCKKAQEAGVIKGILFHHGENNAGDGDGWVTKVVGLAKDLKTDLGLNDSIPFIAGELRYANQNGCCAQLNPFINKLPTKITNCAVVSADGMKPRNPDDSYRAHFDTPSMREFGRRYAKAFLSVADNNLIPRKTITTTPKTISAKMVLSLGEGTKVYALDGKVVASLVSTTNNSLRVLKSGRVYIVSQSMKNGSERAFPFIKE